MEQEQRLMEAGVERLLARMEEAYRRRDARALARLYHPKARYRLSTGETAVGRAEIRQLLPSIFEQASEQIETETISRMIDLITPEVAVIDVLVQHYRRTPTGERETLSVEGSTLVALREGDQWLIGAIRGTPGPGRTAHSAEL